MAGSKLGAGREEPKRAVIPSKGVFLLTSADFSIPEPSFAGALKQNEEVCAEEQEATEGAEFTELSVGEF